MKKIISLFGLSFVACLMSVAQAQPLELAPIAGSYTGVDQLNRPCEVEIRHNIITFDFSAVDYAGQVFEVNGIKTHSLLRELTVNPNNSGNAYVNHYAYFGTPSVFGTYPETRQVLLSWFDGDFSSISINIDSANGPYAKRGGVMCHTLRVK